METKLKIALVVLFLISMVLPDFKGCNKNFSAINVIGSTFDMLTEDKATPGEPDMEKLQEGMQQLESGLEELSGEKTNLGMPFKNPSEDFKGYLIAGTVLLLLSFIFMILQLVLRSPDLLSLRPWFLAAGIALFFYVVDVYLIVQEGEQFFSLRYGWYIHLVMSLALMLYSKWMPSIVSRYEPLAAGATVVDPWTPVPPDIPPAIPHEAPSPTDAPPGFPPTPPPVV